MNDEPQIFEPGSLRAMENRAETAEMDTRIAEEQLLILAQRIEALEAARTEIRDMDGGDEDVLGLRDEWAEAAAFTECQRIAIAALNQESPNEPE
jgi:hypothetical protein